MQVFHSATLRAQTALALSSLSICLVWALPAQGQAQSQTQTQTQTQAQANAASRTAPADRVLAIVNTEAVLQSEFDSRLIQTLISLRQARQPVPPRAQLESELLDRMINDRVLTQRAKQAGITVDDETITRAIERIADQNQMTVAAFQAQLVKEGVLLSSFKAELRDEILITRLREREVETRLRIAESEVDAYLESRKQNQTSRQELRLEQVLVNLPSGSSASERNTLKTQAERLWRRAVSGTELSALAKDLGLRLDDLGWRTEDRLPDLFLKAVAKTAEGQMGELVESPNGFHLLRVVGRREAATGPIVESYRARHILFLVSAEVNAADARKQAETIAARLRAGEPFEQLARQASQDPGSAARGGLLDWAYPGDLVPEFEQAARLLAIGERSAPIRSQFGYHLIEVLERRREPLPQDRIRIAARLALRDQRLAEATAEWTREARANAFVEIKSKKALGG